jgi:hypothetical protein
MKKKEDEKEPRVIYRASEAGIKHRNTGAMSACIDSLHDATRYLGGRYACEVREESDKGESN